MTWLESKTIGNAKWKERVEELETALAKSEANREASEAKHAETIGYWAGRCAKSEARLSDGSPSPVCWICGAILKQGYIHQCVSENAYEQRVKELEAKLQKSEDDAAEKRLVLERVKSHLEEDHNGEFDIAVYEAVKEALSSTAGSALLKELEAARLVCESCYRIYGVEGEGPMIDALKSWREARGL